MLSPEQPELRHSFRRLYPELPIVLMTGDAGAPFVATADAPVLRKPFRHEELVDTIRGLLDP